MDSPVTQHGVTYTHKGWFGPCPVYIADTYTNCPTVGPRHWSLLLLLYFAIWLQQATIGFSLWMDPHSKPKWDLRLTGKLDDHS